MTDIIKKKLYPKIAHLRQEKEIFTKRDIEYEYTREKLRLKKDL